MRWKYFEYLVLTSPQWWRHKEPLDSYQAEERLESEERIGGKKVKKNKVLGHELNQRCKHGFLLLTYGIIPSCLNHSEKCLASHLSDLASPRHNCEWCWAPVYTRGCQQAYYPARPWKHHQRRREKMMTCSGKCWEWKEVMEGALERRTSSLIALRCFLVLFSEQT